MGKAEIEVMLVSFIWVVGLTRILESFGALWVARKRVRFAASQLLWMAAILVDMIGNWFAVAGMNGAPPVWLFAGNLLYSLGMFFAATVVSPRIPAEGVLDLAVYETEEGAAYKVTLIALMLLALPLEYGMGLASYDTVRIGMFLIVAWSAIATLAVFAIGLTRNRHIRTAAAFAALLLGFYGLAVNLYWMATGRELLSTIMGWRF